MRRFKCIIRVAAFMAVFALLFLHVQELVTPDYNWPGSFDRLGNGVRGLYKEPDNSLQVLWLGTSHVRNAVSPMLIYKDTGIRSYNLSTAAQTIALSRSWLKLALKYQSPKVVFLDVSASFYNKKYSRGSNSEAVWRKVIDSLSWYRFADKFALSRDLAKSSGLGLSSVVDGVLPLFRYHTNYLLDDSAYRRDNVERTALLKGYCQMEYRREMDVDAVDGQRGENAEEGGGKDSARTEKLIAALKYNRSFIEDMAQLCRQKGSELILMKIPVNVDPSEHSSYWDQEKHDLIEQLAAEIGCRFIDLNDEDIGIEWALDTSDIGTHMNSSGAKKISSFFAHWLVDNCGFDTISEDIPAGSWDRQLQLYEWEDQFYALQMEYRLQRYIEMLRDGNYTAFITVLGSAGEYWTQEEQQMLAEATGARFDLVQSHASGEDGVYLLVASNGLSVAEKTDDAKCTAKGRLTDGEEYAVSVKKRASKAEAVVSIGGKDYENKAEGINIVVYANDLHCVIDNVRFDTWKEDVPFRRYLKGTRTQFRRALADYEIANLSGQ